MTALSSQLLTPPGDECVREFGPALATSSEANHKETLATSVVTPLTNNWPERKFASVLFIDVKNSMGLSREIELEDWWSLSASLFTLMCECADEFGAWVGAFAGDGVNAIFETTEGQVHHARRACLAALWLRDAIGALAEELRRAHGLELSVRIGINSGTVLTGTMGDRGRRLYTVNGYAVALAKRIESLARPNRIYVSESTAALVSDAFHLDDLGAVEVKGANAPVGVFELLEACGDGESSARGADDAGELTSREPPQWSEGNQNSHHASDPKEG